MKKKLSILLTIAMLATSPAIIALCSEEENPYIATDKEETIIENQETENILMNESESEYITETIENIEEETDINVSDTENTTEPETEKISEATVNFEIMTEQESESETVREDQTVTVNEESELEQESDEPALISSSVKLNSTDVTLYVVGTWATDLVTIPSSYYQSFQIKINGKKNTNVTWTSEDKTIAYVDANGVIHPTATTGNDYVAERTTKLTATYQGEKLEITVTVKNYGKELVNGVIDTYIANNITSSMSTYDKVVKICEFVASYEYSASYSSTDGMILSGGGDCWASTLTIVDMCTRLGIPAHTRLAYMYDGNSVGSNHANAYVEIDGVLYIADAGYYEPAPRYYSLRKVNESFAYDENTDGTLTITGYEGFNVDNVTIPSEIDGKKVTALDEYAFYRHTEITTIEIPSSITSIGEYAFRNCSSLTSVSIPSSVLSVGDYAFASCYKLVSANLSCKNIGDYVFYDDHDLEKVTFSKEVASIGESIFIYCYNLVSVTVDSSNQYFSSSGGVLFNKNKTTLIKYPGNKSGSSYAIPSTVTRLENDSMYQCYYLHELIVPASVKTVGDYAFLYFGYNDLYNQTGVFSAAIYFEGNKPTFGNGAFSYAAVKIYYSKSTSGWTGNVTTDIGATSSNISRVSMSEYGTVSLKSTVTKLTNKTDGIMLTWSTKSTGSSSSTVATSYIIYRKTGSGSYKKIKTITTASTTTYTDETVKSNNGTKYTYKVVPYFGNTRGTAKAKSIVRLTGTALTSIKSNSSGKMTIKWKTDSSITGYQIQYSESKTFASGNVIKKISSNTKSKSTIANLKKGKTYYVRIRTFITINGKNILQRMEQ